MRKSSVSLLESEKGSHMNIILIPGLWLDGSTWDRVTPALEQAGHLAIPLTLPGMESKESDRSGISRQDHVGAIVAAIDAADGPVVLVGHSLGAGLAHAAVDSRPDRVSRAIHVGGFPSGDGSAQAFPAENGEIPFFDWSDFDEADLRGLNEAALAEFRERAIPSPEKAANDPQVLTDPRRYDVPVTMVCPEFTVEMLKEWMAGDMEPVRELAEIKDVTYVDLPTGHWPQFSTPDELARVILDAIGNDR
jgi:pimeloyl-ACP methyl ester carboxylesterase